MKLGYSPYSQAPEIPMRCGPEMEGQKMREFEEVQGESGEMEPGALEKKESSGLRERFGRRLRAWRHSRKYGIKIIARRVGVSVATVSGWETGRRFPTPENLDLLCQFTGLAPCQMFCEMEPSCRTGCFFFSELLQGGGAPDAVTPSADGRSRTDGMPSVMTGESVSSDFMSAVAPASPAS